MKTLALASLFVLLNSAAASTPKTPRAVTVLSDAIARLQESDRAFYHAVDAYWCSSKRIQGRRKCTLHLTAMREPGPDYPGPLLCQQTQCEIQPPLVDAKTRKVSARVLKELSSCLTEAESQFVGNEEQCPMD